MNNQAINELERLRFLKKFISERIETKKLPNTVKFMVIKFQYRINQLEKSLL